MSDYRKSVSSVKRRTPLDALRNVSGNTGKVLQIQGICDMVEEFVGANRDIFRKECVHNRAITEGAHRMWLKKQEVMAHRCLTQEVLYSEFDDFNRYMLNMYNVFYAKYDVYTFQIYTNQLCSNRLVKVDDANEYNEPDYDSYW